MWWYLLPIVIIGGVLVIAAILLGALAFLSRYRNGALLRPLIARLSQIPLLKRFFTRISTAAMERQNPELASALKKMSTVGATANEQAAQKAMSRLTPAERRAYLELAQEQQGQLEESTNRQIRRRFEQQTRSVNRGEGASQSGGGLTSRPGSPKRKRKR
jgi:hypothetical protein